MASDAEANEDAKAGINALAAREDADVFIYNGEIYPPADFRFIYQVSGRRRRRNVILFIVTEGGSADSAFRMMRVLQAKYEKITVAVPGWCKSAGTLMCIGAHELIIGDLGELGPLDVQIVKADEMDEQKSGLVAEAAFLKLQTEAAKFLMQFVRDIGATEYRITMRTASEIATKMTTGLFQPIFEKLDPVTIGEDFRSNRLAQAYAERLNIHTKNLRRNRELDALDTLLSNYPSHGFVIDLKEASDLFKNVKPLPDEMDCVISHLGTDALVPRNSRRDQTPRLEFLNDEPKPRADSGNKSDGSEERSSTNGKAKHARPNGNSGDRPDNVLRNPAEGGGSEPPIPT